MRQIILVADLLILISVGLVSHVHAEAAAWNQRSVSEISLADAIDAGQVSATFSGLKGHDPSWVNLTVSRRSLAPKGSLTFSIPRGVLLFPMKRTERRVVLAGSILDDSTSKSNPSFTQVVLNNDEPKLFRLRVFMPDMDDAPFVASTLYLLDASGRSEQTRQLLDLCAKRGLDDRTTQAAIWASDVNDVALSAAVRGKLKISEAAWKSACAANFDLRHPGGPNAAPISFGWTYSPSIPPPPGWRHLSDQDLRSLTGSKGGPEDARTTALGLMVQSVGLIKVTVVDENERHPSTQASLFEKTRMASDYMLRKTGTKVLNQPRALGKGHVVGARADLSDATGLRTTIIYSLAPDDERSLLEMLLIYPPAENGHVESVIDLLTLLR